ncbi:pyocin activator PrtN family protein [Devosia ginsengisoli]|uniref:pyocin activator PrtN family protein n=1 Tax=Devosia ginsengisoli TaxID=400770 RepID=UPI0026EE2265|nr:pyocin activator PrtN family protein [Devosia ginsengisoli]MCR6673296.1 pyocin activator PrtN family protein [Devosia ginsengisoli]
MKTIFLLMAQYEGHSIIPVERVCADYFAPMQFSTFIQKVNAGKIALPITRMDPSQKGPRGFHVADLAAYIDARREAAAKELAQITGR